MTKFERTGRVASVAQSSWRRHPRGRSSAKGAARLLSVLASVAMLVTLVYAAAGDLDPTYDGDGIALSSLLTQEGHDQGLSVVVQASATQTDEKLVMAGFSE